MITFYLFLLKQDDLTAQWRKHMSPKMVEKLTINADKKSYINPRNLYLLFAIIATLLMSGPTWKKQASPFFEDNSELIIALDVAGSMNEKDLQPTRLKRAKQKVVQLMDTRGDAKTGLVVYGGSAHVAMPVTKDRTLARYFIDVLDAELLPDQTSKPDSFIAPALTLMNKVKVPSTLLILTDKTNSEAVNQLRERFADLEHQVIVWTIAENANSGSDIQTSTTGLNKQELAQLTELAKAGHGQMVTFTHDTSDIDEVYGLIQNNLFSSNDISQPWLDSGYVLLFLLLPIQLLWFRRGWALKW